VADRTLLLDTLTEDEKLKLASHRDQMNNCVAEIKRLPGDERLRWYREYLVSRAMEAAFFIGSHALRNPIVERIRRETVNARAARARQFRQVKSQIIDAAILELAQAVWRKKPSTRVSAGKTADEIFEDVKLRLGPGSPLKTKGAVEKRVRELMKSRMAEQSSG
jgi:hypothetical protein